MIVGGPNANECFPCQSLLCMPQHMAVIAAAALWPARDESLKKMKN